MRAGYMACRHSLCPGGEPMSSLVHAPLAFARRAIISASHVSASLARAPEPAAASGGVPCSPAWHGACCDLWGQGRTRLWARRVRLPALNTPTRADSCRPRHWHRRHLYLLQVMPASWHRRHLYLLQVMPASWRARARAALGVLSLQGPPTLSWPRPRAGGTAAEARVACRCSRCGPLPVADLLAGTP